MDCALLLCLEWNPLLLVRLSHSTQCHRCVNGCVSDGIVNLRINNDNVQMPCVPSYHVSLNVGEMRTFPGLASKLCYMLAFASRRVQIAWRLVVV